MPENPHMKDETCKASGLVIFFFKGKLSKWEAFQKFAKSERVVPGGRLFVATDGSGKDKAWTKNFFHSMLVLNLTQIYVTS